MLIDVPYIFTAEVLFEKQRNPRSHRVQGIHTVAAPVVSGEEAVLVATMRCEEYFEDQAPRMDIRHWGGRFWAPVIRPKDDRQRSPFFEAEEFAERVKTIGRGDHFNLADVERYDWERATPSVAAIGAKKVVSSDRDAMTKKIDDRLQRMLIVDGMVYRQVAEPVMALAGGRHGRYLATGFLGSLNGNTLRADGFDQLMERLAQGRLPLTDEERDQFERDRIDVHRPDLLEWNPERVALVVHLRQLVAEVAKEMGEASVEQFTRYAAFREAVRPLDADRDDGLEDACQAVEAMQVSGAAANRGHLYSRTADFVTSWREVARRDLDAEAIAIGM